MTGQTAAAASHDTLAHIAGALRQGALHRKPFHHLLATGVFPAAMYETMLRSLPPDEFMNAGAAHHYPDRATLDIDAGKASGDPRIQVWSDLFTQLDRPKMIDAVVAALDAEELAAELARQGYALRASSKLVRDRAGYSLNPHKDHFSRFGSVVFALAADDRLAGCGTSFYRRKQPGYRFDNGAHLDRRDFELFLTAPFLPNTAVGFLNFGDCYHGVEPVGGSDLRYSVQLTLYIVSPASSA